MTASHGANICRSWAIAPAAIPRRIVAAFSGGLPFTAAFGTVYSTNITPDRKTGIGNWTADHFYRALHEGIAPGGSHLYPAFPYVYFTRISRAETDAFVRLSENPEAGP